jgi:hypothetical protein
MADDKPIGFWRRLLKVLNAPITIWFLSVIFLSIGGTYYATFQQCHRDFDQFKERYLKIAKEYLTRRREIAIRLIEAKTVTDVKAAVIGKEGMYAELKDRPFYEIEEEYLRLQQQIDFTEVRSANAQQRIDSFINSEAYKQFSDMMEGNLPPVEAKDLPAIRNFGVDFSIFLEDDADAYVRPPINAKCGPTDVLKIARGETIVRGKAEAIVGFIDFATEFVRRKAPSQKTNSDSPSPPAKK